MPKAYLGLGSNLGDRRLTLEGAIEALAETSQIEILSVAPLYETEAWGYEDQPAFLNTVIGIETELSPYDLLAACQAVETAFDRRREIRWGPRTLDVDILLYDDLQMEEADLTIPHPRMHERAFVLAPLANLAPKVPVRGRTVASWLGTFDLEAEGVRRFFDER